MTATTLFPSILLAAACVLPFGCNKSTNVASGDTDTSSDIDTDSAPDTQLGTDSDSQTADTDTETEVSPDTETDTELLDCLENTNSSCSCIGECEDGFGYTMYYPESAEIGTDNWMDPSAELLEAGIAWYFCSVCGSCSSFYRTKDQEQNWTDVSHKEFCQTIVDAERECNGCITTTGGGGG